MSAYLVANYRVTNPEGYAPYPEAASGTLAAAGVEVVAIDMDTEALEGDTYPVTVILKFPSKDAIKAWYNSPEYQAVIGLRTANTEGKVAIINGMD
jgi:uncharacterized protein (DUF1330 family)